ncbi:MAG: gamma-glutamylcyclotransferase family protein, partial [Opitutae bacterium]
MKTLYFAYGSNMNQEQMSTRCRGSELGSLARLTGWRYFINGRGYAGIEESPSDHVLGCFWSLEDEHVASLDRYEGVKGNFYSKETLEVEK